MTKSQIATRNLNTQRLEKVQVFHHLLNTADLTRGGRGQMSAKDWVQV